MSTTVGYYPSGVAKPRNSCGWLVYPPSHQPPAVLFERFVIDMSVASAQ